MTTDAFCETSKRVSWLFKGFLLYYNLGLVFIVLAFTPFGDNNNTLLTKLTVEIKEHGNIT